MPNGLVADVQPLDVTGTRTVALGTVGWVLAFAVLVPFGNADWLWTCVSGVVLGLVGLAYCRRRAERLGDPAAADHLTGTTAAGDS